MNTLQDDAIRDRAYALWVEAGSPEGNDLEYWHRAERELAEEAGLDTSEAAAEIAQPTPPAGTLTH
ncbi:DUF2934 domain-containing protein [Devosia lacusdianchii]|jgi:hypothetical protein|uniref:DUF2934 domain-containing protein n=1 Tax=Devosia lacusdianchii TaxID=2917991 RepID=UPI001F05F005|nr:DUF2934 domain-containing protein [Devosia sp. JXJ CY 41]